MLLCDLIQSHYPKILMLSPVPCNLHRNIIVILTTQSRLSPSHIPLIRSLSRSISRTLIAITVDADMAAKIDELTQLTLFSKVPLDHLPGHTFRNCVNCVNSSISLYPLIFPPFSYIIVYLNSS